MNNKLLLVFLGLGLIAVIYFTVLRPANTFEERICAQVSKQFDDPSKTVFIDVNSNLVFCESDSGVMPVLSNKEFTKVKNAFHELDFQEFREERVDNGPISWQADNDPQEEFSMISGFATNEVKSILINSENDRQPNKLFIRDDLWFWYVTFHKAQVNMPIEVTAFDAKGHNISGENQ